MAFAEDTAPFFADFGTTATIGGAAVRGIFDNGTGEAFGVIGGRTPTFTCSEADISGVSAGTAVVIGMDSYTVAEQPRHDGTGMSTLILEEADA